MLTTQETTTKTGLAPKVRPLTGQVLVRVLPTPTRHGEIHLPESCGTSIESAEFRRKLGRKGIVIAIGPWPKAKNGFGILPPFGLGATVLLNAHAGTKLKHMTEDLWLVRNSEVLAVLTES